MYNGEDERSYIANDQKADESGYKTAKDPSGAIHRLTFRTFEYTSFRNDPNRRRVSAASASAYLEWNHEKALNDQDV